MARSDGGAGSLGSVVRLVHHFVVRLRIDRCYPFGLTRNSPIAYRDMQGL